MVSVKMAVSCGDNHTVAICENGQFFAAGSNFYGQLGLGGDEQRTAMTPVPGLHAPVRQIAAGGCHTGIVTEAGDLLMCGQGPGGRLGLGDEDTRTTPTLVPRTVFDGEAVLMVAVGNWHTVALSEAGHVFTFGFGEYGQLGHGDEENQLAPRRVPAAAFNDKRVVMVAAGYGHTVALSEQGYVYTWGRNLCGQLGHGDEEDELAPRQVEAGRFGGDAPERVVFVAAGGDHTVAVTAGGRLYTWGYSCHGQLGHGDTVSRQVPTLVGAGAFGGSAVVMAACGVLHTLVVTHDGGLWASGSGLNGELGLNNQLHRYVFERVGGATGAAFGGARVVVAAAGGSHSAAVTEDGGLWTWGWGRNGQLGHREQRNLVNPERVTTSPLDTIRIGRFHNAPRALVLAFTMGAQNRLGAASPIRMISGEEGLLSMIAQFTHQVLPPAVKKSEGLMRLLGMSQKWYQMRITMPPSSVMS